MKPEESIHVNFSVMFAFGDIPSTFLLCSSVKIWWKFVTIHTRESIEMNYNRILLLVHQASTNIYKITGHLESVTKNWLAKQTNSLTTINSVLDSILDVQKYNINNLG